MTQFMYQSTFDISASAPHFLPTAQPFFPTNTNAPSFVPTQSFQNLTQHMVANDQFFQSDDLTQAGQKNLRKNGEGPQRKTRRGRGGLKRALKQETELLNASTTETFDQEDKEQMKELEKQIKKKLIVEQQEKLQTGKYRSTNCRNFHLGLACQDGESCSFRHEYRSFDRLHRHFYICHLATVPLWAQNITDNDKMVEDRQSNSCLKRLPIFAETIRLFTKEEEGESTEASYQSDDEKDLEDHVFSVLDESTQSDESRQTSESSGFSVKNFMFAPIQTLKNSELANETENSIFSNSCQFD